MPIQTASNKFLKCHIQAVITQRARLGREVPVGNGGNDDGEATHYAFHQSMCVFKF